MSKTPGAFVPVFEPELPAPGEFVVRFAGSDCRSGLDNGRFLPEFLWTGVSYGHTEAQVVVPVVWRVPVAVRRPAVRRVVVPATAPVHPVRAL